MNTRRISKPQNKTSSTMIFVSLIFVLTAFVSREIIDENYDKESQKNLIQLWQIRIKENDLFNNQKTEDTMDEIINNAVEKEVKGLERLRISSIEESEITDEISDIPETEIQPVTTEKATEISDETDIKHHESTIPSVDTATQNAATGSDKTNDDNSETIISSPSQSLSAEKIYKEALFNNSIYTSSEKEVFSDMLDDFLDYAEMTGFNGEKKVQCTAKVYRIKEYSESIAVAVKFENSEKYYFYSIS